MRTHHLLKVSSLITLALILLSTSKLSAYGESYGFVEGRVIDISGKPVAGATVIAYDIASLRISALNKTNIQGEYFFSLPKGRYRFYVYVKMDENYLYVPASAVLPTGGEYELLVIEGGKAVVPTITLYPAATVKLIGPIYSAESDERATGVIFEIIKHLLDERPDLPPGSLNVYGDTGKAWTAFGILGIDPTTVIIPLNVKVDIKVTAKVYSDLERRYSEISFRVDNEGMGFLYNSSGLYSIDLRPYMMRHALSAAERLVNEVWEDISNMESMGFYVAVEKRSVSECKIILNRAWEKYGLAIYSVSGVDKNSFYNQSFISLREAVAEAKFTVRRRLDYMRQVASYAAIILPYFISLFPASLAFYFADSARKKILLTLILFPITLYFFYHLYPGFRLLNLEALMQHFIASLVVILIVAFMVPRAIESYEKGRASGLFSVFATLFSVAKRYSRKRPTRSILTILSITLLIMVITSLTSFSSAYGIISESFYGEKKGSLIKNLPETPSPEIPYIPINPDVLQVLHGFGVLNVAPLYVNVPLSTPVAEVFNPNDVGRKVKLWGIMAVDVKNEPVLTQMDSLINVWFNQDINCLIDPKMAEQLGVKTGDIVALKIGFSEFLLKVGVWGTYDVKDIDGSPLRPYKMVKVEEKLEAVPVGVDEMIIIPLEIALSPEIRRETVIDLYRVAYLIGDPEKMRSIARFIASTYLYNVWYAPGEGAPGEHLKIGSYLEVRGVAESIVAIVIVALLVSNTMFSVVKERMRETFIFVTVGANPTHVAILFMAESIIMGLLGGLFGYFGGLLFYKAFALFGEGMAIVVRENLEWYWSLIGLFTAVVLSIIASAKPSMDAAVKYSKAFKRKVALTREEREKREEELFKVYQEMRESLPLRVTELEYPFFTGFVKRRLTELSVPYVEWVEDVIEEETVEGGGSVKRLRFTYVWTEAGERYPIDVAIQTIELPDAVYGLEMLIKPRKPATPATVAFRPTRIIREIIKEWDREKKRIIGK